MVPGALMDHEDTTNAATEAAAETAPHDRRSVLRSLMESAICLLLAVMLFRTFAAEGYMISTGSMAPHLLGFHKRVECPHCHYPFPFGVAYDTDEADVSAAEYDPGRTHATCPNCGQRGISLADVPRNHGDQLLVFKPAYALRTPHRWEIIVFRNPQNPREAYVKRVVGLPGESVQIIDGDVYADGRLCRKDLAMQHALRIPVHDHRFEPPTDEELPYWQPLANSTPETGWQADEAAFVLNETARGEWAWVEYGQRVRYRGQHMTTVGPVTWPDDIEPSQIPPAGLKYNPQTEELSCVGALPVTVRDQLLAHPAEESFHQAVQQLYEQSQLAPVTDDYGYNPHDGEIVPLPLRDVSLSLDLKMATGEGEFAIEMTDGNVNFTAVFDLGRRSIRLYAADHPDPVCEDHIPDRFGSQPVTIEMSLFDQQVLVAIDGSPVLSPWSFQTPEQAVHTRYPIRFGAQGLAAKVTGLTVHRDVYYTGTRSRHAIQAPYALAEDELFVLGDNSPVSHDSRRWPDGAVNLSLLVGKPFVVHLPSKPARLRLGPWETQLRLPDFERMQLLP
ncbi:signal peptidase I [bacterium]|nr:signal peptidase I [bacterium]